jgi:peptidoglycan hydrolase-like protein with peptidoglycan-binding domain
MLNNDTFYKTFTGMDALAFMMLPEAKPILLGSLTTLSHSVYREKKPVPLLGRINTGGYTRGMRSIAGTMVFTLINQHLIEDILTQIPYLKEHGKMKADELPFFDVMVICANEYGVASQMMLYGVEFFEDGQVVSVQDLYIENTFSFVARDMDDFAKIDAIVSKGSSNTNATADAIVSFDYSKDGYDNAYDSLTKAKSDNLSKVQQKLTELGFTTPITGVLDNTTLANLSSYQRGQGLNQTGYLDSTTYDLLMGNVTGEVVKVTNTSGTYVYADASKNTIIGIAKYDSNYVGELDPTKNFVKIKYYDQTAYIDVNDTSLAVQTLKYTYSDTTPRNSTDVTNLANFTPSMIGTNVSCNKDTTVKTTAIAYYLGGNTAVFQRSYNLKAGTSKNLNLSNIPDAYIENTQYGMPYRIEYIMAPTGDENTKWIVKLNDNPKKI